MSGTVYIKVPRVERERFAALVSAVLVALDVESSTPEIVRLDDDGMPTNLEHRSSGLVAGFGTEPTPMEELTEALIPTRGMRLVSINGERV